jgi:hypothetical protein
MKKFVTIFLFLLLAAAVYGILPGSGYSSEIISILDPPPDYFTQSLGTDHPDILDDRYYAFTLEEYIKPPPPPIADPESFKLKRLPYKGKIKTINNDSPHGGWLRYYTITIGSFVDSLLGNVWWTGSSSIMGDGRKEDNKHPGFYLNPPNAVRETELSQIEKDSLFGSINELLINRFNLSRDVEFISKFENVFGDSSRTEFYGRYEFVDNDISVGGWIGKFTSIAIFTNFTDVNSFLEQAERFYRLPPVNRDKIIVYEKKKEYMIFMEDRENMFILRGYDVYVHCGETPGKTYLKAEIARVIELTKYYDEEFMP